MRRKVSPERRVVLTGLAASASLLPAGAAIPQPRDRQDRPPVLRTFFSRSRAFRLIVRVTTPKDATAELWAGRDGHLTRRWTRALPHEWGPRTALVTDKGFVLLVDEWINVIPRHALMIVDPAGRIVADYSGEQVITHLGVARSQISAAATTGPWRSGDPQLTPDGAAATLQAGGRTLTLDMARGRLKVTGDR